MPTQIATREGQIRNVKNEKKKTNKFIMFHIVFEITWESTHFQKYGYKKQNKKKNKVYLRDNEVWSHKRRKL